MNNIILIGFMGSGKTTVAKFLHSLSHWPVMDTDKYIEAKENTSINALFKAKGETYFRALEHQVLMTLAEDNTTNTIISTGGGLAIQESNHALLKQCGSTYYLKAPLNTLLDRTKHSKTRPLLKQPKEAIQALYDKRDPIYSRVADHIIQTENSSLQDIANIIWKTHSNSL